MDEGFGVFDRLTILIGLGTFAAGFFRAVTVLGFQNAITGGVYVLGAFFYSSILFLSFVFIIKHCSSLKKEDETFLEWHKKIINSQEKILRCADRLSDEVSSLYSLTSRQEESLKALETHLCVLEEYKKGKSEIDIKKASKELLRQS